MLNPVSSAILSLVFALGPKVPNAGAEAPQITIENKTGRVIVNQELAKRFGYSPNPSGGVRHGLRSPGGFPGPEQASNGPC